MDGQTGSCVIQIIYIVLIMYLSGLLLNVLKIFRHCTLTEKGLFVSDSENRSSARQITAIPLRVLYMDRQLSRDAAESASFAQWHPVTYEAATFALWCPLSYHALAANSAAEKNDWIVAVESVVKK